MDPARWSRIKSLFGDVLDRPAVDQAACLLDACGSDVELRADVERLLAAHLGAGVFLDPSHLQRAAGAPSDGDAAGLPDRIGAYRILRELGQGGMGAVYLAERDEPGLRRAVAIKVLPHGLSSRYILQRFHIERQILASLEHPGIARFYDGGTTDEGLPYLVMEFVDGENLLAYCDTHRYSIAERVALFVRVCQAVQFAHQSLIVHRDLKPSNILVTPEGEPKLLDFGIAKILSPQIAGEPVEETIAVARLLTPQYASPEQVRGTAITTATDVYSLGVLLYELLTSARPYTISSRAAQDIELAVCNTEPQPPSTVVADRRLRRQLRGDLDNIVLKALRKRPEERYSTASELAEDLRRYQQGLPVRAKRGTRFYRARKFVARHRAAVAAAGIAAASLIAGLTLSLWQMQVARAERDHAAAEAMKSREVTAFLRSLFESSDPRRADGARITVRDLLDGGAARVDAELARQPEVQASMLALLGSVYVDISLPTQAAPLLEKSLRLRQDALGPNHVEVAESLFALGRMNEMLGKYDAAQPLLERSVSIREQALGPNALPVAEALGELSAVFWRQGRYARGRSAASRAVSIGERAGGKNLAPQLNVLANCDLALGDLDNAQRSLERALAIVDRPGGSEAQTEVTLLNLAGVLTEQEDFAGAMRLFDRALPGVQRVYGTESQAMAYTLGELGNLHAAMGERARAHELLEQSLDISTRVLGSEHHGLAAPLTYSGRLLLVEGQPRDALPLFERALQLREKALGSRAHNDVAETLVDVAMAKSQLEGPRVAEPIARRALGIQRQVLDPGHRSFVRTLTVLGQLRARTGATEEATTLLQEAVGIARLQMPERHSLRLGAEAALRDLSASPVSHLARR